MKTNLEIVEEINGLIDYLEKELTTYQEVSSWHVRCFGKIDQLQELLDWILEENKIGEEHED